MWASKHSSARKPSWSAGHCIYPALQQLPQGVSAHPLGAVQHLFLSILATWPAMDNWVLFSTVYDPFCWVVWDSAVYPARCPVLHSVVSGVNLCKAPSTETIANSNMRPKHSPRLECAILYISHTLLTLFLFYFILFVLQWRYKVNALSSQSLVILSIMMSIWTFGKRKKKVRGDKRNKT